MIDEILEIIESHADDTACLADDGYHASDVLMCCAAYSRLRARAANHRAVGAIGRATDCERAANRAMGALRADDINSAVAYLRAVGMEVRI